MYRKYRVGELPDIQIKHSELIVPLQALAQLDSKTGMKLFSSLLNAVISKLPDKLDDISVERVHGDLQEALDIMLRSSTVNDPCFTHAVQNVCYNNKELKLDPALISNSSTASMQQSVGILLLEKQLLGNVNVADNGAPSSSKRRKTMLPEKPEDVANWLEIAKLYEDINDFDWLRSVFSSHVSKSETTKKALSAETQNDYELALNLYKKVYIYVRLRIYSLHSRFGNFDCCLIKLWLFNTFYENFTFYVGKLYKITTCGFDNENI